MGSSINATHSLIKIAIQLNSEYHLKKIAEVLDESKKNITDDDIKNTLRKLHEARK